MKYEPEDGKQFNGTKQSQSHIDNSIILGGKSDQLKEDQRLSEVSRLFAKESQPAFPPPTQGVDDSFYGDWDMQGMAQSMRKDGRDEESANKILK